MKTFPVGGPRQPVYSFLRDNGFMMMVHSDKHWVRADRVHLHLYGAGSMARIMDSDNKCLADGPLAEAMANLRRQPFAAGERQESK